MSIVWITRRCVLVRRGRCMQGGGPGLAAAIPLVEPYFPSEPAVHCEHEALAGRLVLEVAWAGHAPELDLRPFAYGSALAVRAAVALLDADLAKAFLAAGAASRGGVNELGLDVGWELGIVGVGLPHDVVPGVGRMTGVPAEPRSRWCARCYSR